MTSKAHTAIQEAREAAELEGLFEPSEDQLKALRRHRDLVKRRNEINEELKAIEASISADLEELGGRAFVVNGKNAVLVSDVNRTVFDKDAFSEEFPEIVAAYEEKSALYVSKRKEERARTTFNTKVI